MTLAYAIAISTPLIVMSKKCIKPMHDCNDLSRLDFSERGTKPGELLAVIIIDIRSAGICLEKHNSKPLGLISNSHLILASTKKSVSKKGKSSWAIVFAVMPHSSNRQMVSATPARVDCINMTRPSCSK